jgi:hypothetical protein
LLKKGYQRTADGEVFRHFSRNRERSFVGKAGTMIAEDTIGLHKGQNVQKGDRLVLQIQYTNSLFGDVPEIKKAKAIHPMLIDAVRRHPAIFRHCYDLNGAI